MPRKSARSCMYSFTCCTGTNVQILKQKLQAEAARHRTELDGLSRSLLQSRGEAEQAAEAEAAQVHPVNLLYWHQSTNTDAEAAQRETSAHRCACLLSWRKSTC
jgi:hypothetical protein